MGVIYTLTRSFWASFLLHIADFRGLSMSCSCYWFFGLLSPQQHHYCHHHPLPNIIIITITIIITINITSILHYHQLHRTACSNHGVHRGLHASSPSRALFTAVNWLRRGQFRANQRARGTNRVPAIPLCHHRGKLHDHRSPVMGNVLTLS